MSNGLDCTYYFNSRVHSPPPAPCGQWVDLAESPSAAHDLIRLGLSIRRDLPAVLLTEAGGKLRVIGRQLSAEEAQRLACDQALGGGGVRVYGSSWCPDCRRAKRLLDEAGIPYDEVIVDEDAQAEAMILERSGGRRVVPTLVFDDRHFAFNPDPALLRRLIARLVAEGAPVDQGG